MELALHLLLYICSVLSQLTLGLSKMSTLHHLLLASFVQTSYITNIAYIVLTVSLIEFIIAQSSHAMKGILIGIYYVIRFWSGWDF